uniref:Uncharacterized protein n=1 Tax=Nelumbo nucifera TaxID=4432 RepID=A0A822YEU4_NELNU|nr:TPA_asm: hypothetical protein HUJ06_031237 [Nelumbo nucifera]
MINLKIDVLSSNSNLFFAVGAALDSCTCVFIADIRRDGDWCGVAVLLRVFSSSGGFRAVNLDLRFCEVCFLQSGRVKKQILCCIWCGIAFSERADGPKISVKLKPRFTLSCTFE